MTTLKKTTHQTLDVLISPFLEILQFQIKIQHKFYSSVTCACSEINQCHTYKAVSFQTATLSASCSLTPERAHSRRRADTRSALWTQLCFQRGWHNYCPRLTIVTLGCVSHTYGAFLQYCVKNNLYWASAEKNETLSFNTEREEFWKMFPEKKASISVAET